MAPADIPAVITLADSLASAPHWPPKTYQFALDPANKPERIALVAEAPDGAIAGFAVGSVAGPDAELESIAVQPQFQRQGVARSLFCHLADLLSQRAIQKVFLEVRASNKAALGLYVSLGFSESGRRKAYYTEPIEDAIVLQLGICHAGPPDPG